MTNIDRPTDLNQIINRLVHSTDSAETQALYKEWAVTYEEDLDNFGYLAPKMGVAIFHEAFNHPQGLVLDAGCGTGLVGQELAKLGYAQPHGVDFSPAMLASAKQSGHYAKLMEADFSQPAFLQALAVADGTYEAAISIGVYSRLMEKTLIPELIRVIKPGGIICFSARLHYVEEGLAARLKAYAADGLLKVVSSQQKVYMAEQNADAIYFVLEKV